MEDKIKLYGSITDLEARWHILEPGEEARATALIRDANYLLRQIAANNGVDLDANVENDPTGVYERNIAIVIMDAVQRELGTPTDIVPDATNFTQSATPYSEQMSFARGFNGNLYFKQRELKVLGLSSVSGNSQISILRGARGVNDGLEGN